MNAISDNKPVHDPLLGINEVMRLTSLSKGSLYRMMRAGCFPEAIALTPGGTRVAWRESEVLRWVAAPMEWGMERDF